MKAVFLASPYMNNRMESLHPPAQHLRGLGHSRDILDGDVGVADHARRAARGKKAHIGLYKAIRQINETRLVED
jgi:hypothetical protein